MAELKRTDEYQYDPYEAPIQTSNDSIPVRQTSYQNITQAPVLPAGHFKRLSKMEKFILSLILMGIIGISVGTIQLRTTITKVEDEISSIQTEIAEKNSSARLLEQEKSELSRKERVKEVADKKGMVISDDNLRKLK
ncbi:cell division protein FtsL [Enterococcus sp. PF1-24]|uniref:cell division protein FtsL n=1 Tax=unclassified Enterococcus TaxID=2608891 RepID=UPI002473A25A|nr:MULTISPECIES: cell division protein FtsL [unclassified Enterococcus]MDH6364441.1 cell division protein FtsL [Enterococcus sp. PFB1-1]MDH6401536.1 cell division protein FtsL [Enterococcus sp. PF1-24]